MAFLVEMQARNICRTVGTSCTIRATQQPGPSRLSAGGHGGRGMTVFGMCFLWFLGCFSILMKKMLNQLNYITLDVAAPPFPMWRDSST